MKILIKTEYSLLGEDDDLLADEKIVTEKVIDSQHKLLDVFVEHNDTTEKKEGMILDRAKEYSEFIPDLKDDKDTYDGESTI